MIVLAAFNTAEDMETNNSDIRDASLILARSILFANMSATAPRTYSQSGQCPTCENLVFPLSST